MSDTQRRNWLKVYFLASAALLVGGAAFAYGLAVGVYQIFPYQILQSSVQAARDFASFPRHYARLEPEKWLAPAPEPTPVEAGEAAFDGVTLVDGFFGDSTGMQLVDMDGSVLHEWRVSFNALWSDTDHIDARPHDWDVQIHGAMLYPNGDIVFNFQYAGLARIDKCSRPIWRLPRQTHHSVHADADGNLWVPSRRLREDGIESLPSIPPPVYEDYILKVSPEGEVLREISILEAIVASTGEGVLFANGAHTPAAVVPLDGDFTHLNDIEVLESSMATAFPQFAAGDLLVSLRNLDLVMVLDGHSGRVKWSMVGPYLRQHDPDFLPNGKISVFDNRRDSTGGREFGGSRILEIDPLTRDVVVRYGRDGDVPFYTATMGDHQYLPNGNLLITESQDGHAFEVAPAGTIVWSYLNRWDDDSVAQIGRAIRYPRSYLATIEAEKCEHDEEAT